MLVFEGVLTARSTQPMKMYHPKRKAVFQPSVLRGYLKLGGCILFPPCVANQVATGEHALADDEVFDPKAVADESSKAACRCGNGPLSNEKKPGWLGYIGD